MHGGDLDEGESSVDTKVAELEKLVNEMSSGMQNSTPSSYRKPISEFKVIQKITQLLEDRSKLYEASFLYPSHHAFYRAD